jgi:hypothetical protein
MDIEIAKGGINRALGIGRGKLDSIVVIGDEFFISGTVQ